MRQRFSSAHFSFLSFSPSPGKCPGSSKQGRVACAIHGSVVRALPEVEAGMGRCCSQACRGLQLRCGGRHAGVRAGSTIRRQGRPEPPNRSFFNTPSAVICRFRRAYRRPLLCWRAPCPACSHTLSHRATRQSSTSSWARTAKRRRRNTTARAPRRTWFSSRRRASTRPARPLPSLRSSRRSAPPSPPPPPLTASVPRSQRDSLCFPSTRRRSSVGSREKAPRPVVLRPAAPG